MTTATLYTIEDISEHTHLKVPFIRRCITALKKELSPHMQRSDNKNSLLFDTNALTIFDQIMQLKDAGCSLPTIKEKLQLTAEPKVNKQVLNLENSTNQTLSNSMNEDFISMFLEKLEASNKAILEAKNESLRTKDEVIKLNQTLSEKEHVIAVQQQHLLLLTDGKPPEEVKSVKEEKAKKVQSLLTELESLEGKWFSGKRKKTIIKELQELT